MNALTLPSPTSDHDAASSLQPCQAASWSTRVVDRLDPLHAFNFRHFRPRHMAAELLRTAGGQGARPGSEAPDFALETTDGGRVRLRDLRGRPVLLHFGSYT